MDHRPESPHQVQEVPTCRFVFRRISDVSRRGDVLASEASSYLATRSIQRFWCSLRSSFHELFGEASSGAFRFAKNIERRRNYLRVRRYDRWAPLHRPNPESIISYTK